MLEMGDASLRPARFPCDFPHDDAGSLYRRIGWARRSKSRLSSIRDALLLLTESFSSRRCSSCPRWNSRALASGCLVTLARQSISWCLFSLTFLTRSSVLHRMETEMNSVERVLEYLEIPQESPLVVPETAPPAYWPSNSGETLVSDILLLETRFIADDKRRYSRYRSKTWSSPTILLSLLSSKASPSTSSLEKRSVSLRYAHISLLWLTYADWFCFTNSDRNHRKDRVSKRGVYSSSLLHLLIFLYLYPFRSGKSTLGMSFLRFTEFTSGTISVDGIDISTIGLQNLREKISIIPQVHYFPDPSLLANTASA